MTKDEAPPPSIWASDDAIKEWFDDLEVRRETRQYDADITGWEQPDDDEFEQNELAIAAKRRMGLK